MIKTIKEYTKQGSLTSKLANITSICFEEIDNLNWVGFYIYDEDLDLLVLGPFQGKKATSVIKLTEGVCGDSFTNDRINIVDDVHTFCGHIACDVNSFSELVIPLHKEGKIVAVMDIDSPIKARFNSETVEKFKEVAAIIEGFDW